MCQEAEGEPHRNQVPVQIRCDEDDGDRACVFD